MGECGIIGNMHKYIPVIGLFSSVVILAMLNFTDPIAVGPLGVLVFFTTFYLLLFCSVFLILRVVKKIVGRGTKVQQKDYFYSLVIGFGPIILLLLRTFGEFQWWMVGVAVFFVFMGCFLVKNRFSVIK